MFGRKTGDIALVLIIFQIVYIFYLYSQNKFVNVTNSSSPKSKDNEQNCEKPFEDANYTICNNLPFSKVECEDPMIQRDYDEFGKHYKVPNSVHVIWFGEGLTFTFYNYLALRSMASIQRPRRIVFHYSVEKPSGPHWRRVMKEIPCLSFKQQREPTSVFGVELEHPIARTDAARIEILINHGGIYVDLDVITLKNFDYLRRFPITFGRSVEIAFSMGILLAERNSIFLKEFYKEYPIHYGDNIFQHFTTRYIKTFYQKRTELEAHIEETSLNRPNPFSTQDGGHLATTLGRFDISDNYFLHIHPSRALYRPLPEGADFSTWREKRIRTEDNVYGAAARMALFGSEDLVFKTGEETRYRASTEKIRPFEPLKRDGGQSN